MARKLENQISQLSSTNKKDNNPSETSSPLDAKSSTLLKNNNGEKNIDDISSIIHQVGTSKLGITSNNDPMGTGMSSGDGLINQKIDPTLGGITRANYKTNSPIPKKSPDLKKPFHLKKPLKNQASLLTPKFGLIKVLRNRLANIDAIPDTLPLGDSEGGGASPAPNPVITPVIELLTQGGSVLTTQAKDNLITQQQ